MKIAIRYGCICLFFAVFAFLQGCEAKLPEFAGVYVLQNGKYTEVPRIKDLRNVEFNHQRREGFFGGQDFNIKVIINKDKFMPVDKDIFNKNGFLVVQNKEWSEFTLLRVPTDDFLKDNGKDNEIITGVGYGGGMMGMPFSLEGLHKEVKAKAIDIKQAKKGENAFIYVPSQPVEKGFYLVDFKINGQGTVGYNPIYVK